MGGYSSSAFSDTNEDVFDQKSISVTSAGVELKTDIINSTGLQNRQFVRVYNKGPNKIFVGPVGVTTSTGEELFKNQWIEFAIKNKALWAITAVGETATVIVTDLG